MKKIIFLCHGNICRSPVAEIIFNHLIKNTKLEKEYIAESYALSSEEDCNDIYPPMKIVLTNHGYNNPHHVAHKVSKETLNKAYMIFYMDEENKWIIDRHFAQFSDKSFLISKYHESINEIEDPWYTGRFEYVYQEIYECVNKIVENLK